MSVLCSQLFSAAHKRQKISCCKFKLQFSVTKHYTYMLVCCYFFIQVFQLYTLFTLGFLFSLCKMVCIIKVHIMKTVLEDMQVTCGTAMSAWCHRYGGCPTCLDEAVIRSCDIPVAVRLSNESSLTPFSLTHRERPWLLTPEPRRLWQDSHCTWRRSHK